MINVSELINDPDFAQPNGITIIHRTYTVVNHKPEITKTEENVKGIITIDREKQTTMLDTYDRISEEIHIFTYKKLFTTGRDNEDPENNRLSDIVVFEGNKYRVMSCLNDAQYGFCRSTATLIRQDVA